MSGRVFIQQDGNRILVPSDALLADWPGCTEEVAVSASDAEKARSFRNNLLTETDWWATSDRTMTAEQTAYRQALRDITSQAGFPTDITWPMKPE